MKKKRNPLLILLLVLGILSYFENKVLQDPTK